MRPLIALVVCIALSGQTMAAVHHYQITLDASKRLLSIRAQLAAGVYMVSARDADESGIRNLQSCNGSNLSLRRDHVRSRINIDCFEYTYQIKTTGNDERVKLPNDVYAAAPSQWLLMPRLLAGDKINISLQLPAAIRASVPWQPTASGFVLTASPESGTGIVFFGNLLQKPLQLANSQLRVTLIPKPETAQQTEKMFSWLRAAARDVEKVSGVFPITLPQVVVIAIEKPGNAVGSGAVPFGHVIRDGGESVRFYVNSTYPLDDFLNDWTATHEFAHLLLPYVRSKQKWVSEGFASYYQNVLLARRGVYSEQEAWQKLHHGFRKAGQIRNPPAPEDAHRRDFWDVRMLIYWSGAAMALLADTKLREISGGKESLDKVLGRFQSCCLPAESVWSAEEFFEKLDELTNYPVFSSLYTEVGAHKGMPNTRESFEKLGIVTRGDKVVRLLNQAPLAIHRRNIMTGGS